MQHGNGATTRSVGLDPAIRACLFDLDGVLTQTAKLHAEAWKKTFDTFLRAYDAHTSRSDPPFDDVSDYADYVDGRTRADGTRTFLASRGITLPEGDENDAPGTETVAGIGAAKQWAFVSLLEVRGPQVFDGSVRYVHAVRALGLACAVVTSSANCEAVLRTAGIADLFDGTVDGRDVEELGLHGKPAPDSYLLGAERLGVTPAQAAVFEDALAGVEAGRAGKFGQVVGVDRLGGEQGAHLRKNGATVVVRDLAELLENAGAGQ